MPFRLFSSHRQTWKPYTLFPPPGHLVMVNNWGLRTIPWATTQVRSLHPKKDPFAPTHFLHDSQL